MSKLFTGSKYSRAPLAPFLLLPVLTLCSAWAQADVAPAGEPAVIYFNQESVPQAESAPEARAPAMNGNAPNATYTSQIQAAAAANNIDSALIRAVISAESGHNPYAVSRKGAVGLMQLMPATANRYNVTDSRDPEQNINAGARYLGDLLQTFNSNLDLALAAYNAGEQAVMKYGNRIPPYRETMAYVPRVLKYYERYRNGGMDAMESSGYVYEHFATTGTSIIFRVPVTRTSVHRFAAAGTSTIYRVAAPGTVSYKRARATIKKHSPATKVAWTVSTGGNSVVVSRVR